MDFSFYILATFFIPPSTWLTPNNASSLNHLGFPGGSDVKESACKVGDLGSIPGLGRSPGEGNGNSLQYSCPENSHGQKSLASCIPWGHIVWHNWATKHTLYRRAVKKNNEICVLHVIEYNSVIKIKYTVKYLWCRKDTRNDNW